MLKIAMLGADSSHVEAYAELMNLPDSPFAERARVVALWGEDHQQAQHKAQALHIPTVAASPAEALHGVDLVMVESRFGEDHYPLAKLALEAGIPTYVDKPITNSLPEAEALYQLAADKHVPLFSCSPLRYAAEVIALDAAALSTWQAGNIAGLAAYPALGERANNSYFYGVHLVELLVTVFGAAVEAVLTLGDSVVVRYADQRVVTLHFLQHVTELYHVTAFLPAQTLIADIDAWGDFYPRTLAHILDFAVRRQSPIPATDTLTIMRVLDAIDRGKRQGGEWLGV